jgi:fatty acid CoA ligase FadD36
VQTIRVGAESATREQFDIAVEALAARLAGHRTVAVVAHPSMRTIQWVQACIAVGATAVPISADEGPREHGHVLVDSGATLLCDGESADPLPGGAPPVDAALVLYTSGTTGLPKGVPLTAHAIDSCLQGLADAWAWSADDTLVHGLPLHHVHGLVLGALGALRIGSSLHHTARPTPAAYGAARGTLYFGVPTVWSRIAADESAARSLSSARLLVSGSAALPGPVFDALHRLAGQAPVERYGMTETLITAAARGDEQRRRGSVGRALPGVELRLVGDDGTASRQGALGRLEVRGDTVLAGYLNLPSATAAAFTEDGWFRTGDIATIDDDGLVRIVGRADTDLIKSGGYRIGAGEVEDALLAHPAVREAAVVGVADDDLGQRIVAFVVADGRCTESELIELVAVELSQHKRPRAVVFVTDLPRNAMGKVDKRSLLG